MTNLEKQQARQKAFEDFKATLKDKTLDELKALEKELIEEADKVDNEVKNATFETPKENYKEVCNAIRLILDKVQVQWQYTLGLVAMYDFWNPEKREKNIPYPMLDSTLRTLGERQFTGYQEWAAVVAINKFFEPLRDAYVETSESVYNVAMKHNEVMNQIKLNEPASDIPDEMAQ